MYKEGLFGDPLNPEVRKKVLQLLEFGNVSEIFDDVDLDTSQAKRENEQFINHQNLQRVPHPLEVGQWVVSLPAFDFEDHEIHIQTHNKLRKSPRYRQMTEELRKGLDFHVMVHEMFRDGLIKSPIKSATLKAVPPAGVISPPPAAVQPPPPPIGIPEIPAPIQAPIGVPPTPPVSPLGG